MRLWSTVGLSLLILMVVAAELLHLGDALEYRRDLLMPELWRLLTGHYVHLSLVHAMLNCVALLLLGRLFVDRMRPVEFWTMLGIVPLLISLVFWLALPELQWYRGLSGTLHGIFFAGCVLWLATTSGRARWLPIAALAVGAIKVLYEQPWDASFPFRQWLGAAVVPQAHLVGAVAGLAAGLWLKQTRRKHGQ